MILVDSSVWIDFLREEESAARQTLEQLIEKQADLAITEIIFTEVLQGIRGDGDFLMIRDYLLEFPIYRPQGLETYLHAAQLYRNCRKRGKTIRKALDCIIAAVCIENDLVLLHQDSDFTSIAECCPLKCYQVAGEKI